ncbi:unnamed protein product [Caenorhabditis auriculariae]|uniref:Protein kinase domain-containing protein n=1 Tax=Caenorhabditis auriculariae TaxID=2777116 RepID=A0A8S1HEW8_9PELO|nr:unnamed protein product [Caenorhabditis auriculariae]
MLRGPQPQIIVEEPEEDEEEEETSDVSLDTSRSRLRINLGNFNTRMYNDINDATDLAEARNFAAPSPTPSTASNISRHDFSSTKLSDAVMKGMMQIGTISERTKLTRLRKYINSATMAQYAVVEWDLSSLSAEAIEKICDELELLSQCRHKRIASIYGFYHKDKNLSIFRSFLPAGSIADKLRRGPLPEWQALKFAGQIMSGLRFLHEKGKIHGNITTSNLLLTLSNDIQLADMLIKEAYKDFDSFPVLTTSADIWAVGCTVVSMVTRFAPFQDHFLSLSGDALHKALCERWQSGSLAYTSQTLTPTASKELTELIDTIFVVDPSQRPTASQLLEAFQSSRKTSIRTSVTSIQNKITKEGGKVEFNDYYRRSHNSIEESTSERESMFEKEGDDTFNSESTPLGFLRWYISRIIIFSIMLVKWIGMVLCAALSLALVAGSVFLSIFIIYNGIQVVCQCQLNEGFVVLIALILLPIIILLTTLCCNNSLEKYHHDVELGKVEKCKYVLRSPEQDVVLCGIIVVDGKPAEQKENRRKVGVTEDVERGSQTMTKTDFLSGVARIA